MKWRHNSTSARPQTNQLSVLQLHLKCGEEREAGGGGEKSNERRDNLCQGLSGKSIYLIDLWPEQKVWQLTSTASQVEDFNLLKTMPPRLQISDGNCYWVRDFGSQTKNA